MKTNRSKTWSPLLLTHFLSVLNDNLLKGAITFLAVRWAPEEWTAWILAASSFFLVLPFLMLSAWGGRLSSGHAKAKVVERAKQAEVPLMTFAAISMWTQNLWMALATLLLMGVQSALHAPSKLGLIAETAKGGERSWGTGMMEMLAFAGVLLGMLVAGWVAEAETARNLFAGLFIAVACLGTLSARLIKYRWPAKNRPLPTALPLRFFRKTWKAANQPKGLQSILLGEGAFWLMGSMLQLILLFHLPIRYGATSSQTASVVAAMAVGIGLGCWLTGRLCSRRFEPGLVAISSWGMLVLFIIAATADLSFTGIGVVMFFIAFLSGTFKVPLNVWVQQRVPEQELGRILALSNMISFGFILIGAGLFAGLATFMSGEQMFGFMVLITAVTSIVVSWVMFDRFIYSIGWILSRVIFKIRFRGMENIPKTGGALVVANHGSYLDFLLIVAAMPRRVRFVMLKDVYDKPFLNPLLRKLHMVPINPRKGGNNLEDFNQRVRAEINAGHVVCIFAEGTVSRTGQMLVFKKGIEHLSKGLDAPIIPIHYDNVPGTPMTYPARFRKLAGWAPSNWRKKLTCTIGAPEPAPVKASNIRTRMKEMEAEAFAMRPRPNGSISEVVYRKLETRKHCIEDPAASMSLKSLKREARALAVELERLPDANLAIAYHNDLNLQVAVVAGILARKTILPIAMHATREDAMLTAQLGRCETILTTRLQAEHWGQLGGLNYFVRELDQSTDAFPIRKWAGRLHRSLWGWRPLPFPENKAVFRVPDYSGGFLGMLDITAENIWAVQTGLEQVAFTQGLRKIMLDLPTYESWGLALPVLASAFFKLDVVLAGDADVVEVIQSSRPQAAVMGVEDLDRLIHHGPQDLSFLSQVHTGPERIAPEVLAQLKARGTQVLQSAGTNLTGSLLSVNMPDFEGPDMVGFPMYQKNAVTGSAGRPLPGIAVRIVDPTDMSKQLLPGEVGRVLVKGAAVARGQVSSWAENLSDCMKDWVLTPMMGAMDEHGFLRLQPKAT